MARSNRGGFGSNPIGGPSRPENQPAPNRRGRGGALTARANRPLQQRRKPSRGRTGRGGGGSMAEPAATANPLDQSDTTNAFNDQENYNLGAWGMLNQAGIDQGRMGDAERMFAENWIGDMVDRYQSQGLVADPNLTFENAMYGNVPGIAPPPTAPAGAGDLLGFRPWAKQERGINRRQFRDLNPGRRGRLRTAYTAYNQTPQDGAAGGALSSAPDIDAWRTGTFYPGLRKAYQDAWAAATEQQRGYDSTRWRAPGRVIPF